MILFALVLLLCISAVSGADDSNVFVNSLGMTFRRVPAGTYTVGPPGMARNEAVLATGNPRAGEKVGFSKPFYMGAHEVRVRDYRAFCEATGRGEPVGEVYDPRSLRWRSGFQPFRDQKYGRRAAPVTCVSFDDAVAFCAWLSAKERRAYRLPTEVEWEYAARAGGNKPLQAFDRFDPTKINCNLAKDHPIEAKLADQSVQVDANLGQIDKDEGGEAGAALGAMLRGDSRQKEFPPNAWGLYHMLGNVQEFVVMTKKPSAGAVPHPGWTVLPKKVNRMLRGGSWCHGVRDCTVYQCNFNGPPYSNCTIGFRVLLDADQAAAQK